MANHALTVSQAEVGTTTWQRLVRDASLLPLTERLAIPADLVVTPALRALALAWALPTRSALTGLAALWVAGFLPGPYLSRVDVAVPRGAHPDPPAGAHMLNWDWHTDPPAFDHAGWVGGVRVALPHHAGIAALRRADHRLAIPAVAAALREGACDWAALDEAIHGHSRRGPGYDRMLSACAALRAAIPAACGEPR